MLERESWIIITCCAFMTICTVLDATYLYNWLIEQIGTCEKCAGVELTIVIVWFLQMFCGFRVMIEENEWL